MVINAETKSILTELQTFLAVAEYRNFRRAAAELGLTSAAVSKSIARLESATATRLFHRTTRRVELSPEGALFLGHCKQAAAAVLDGLKALDLARDSTTGIVRISAPHVLGGFFSGSLSRLISRNAGLEIDLRLSDHSADLAAGEVDIAIRIGQPAEPDLITRRLARLNWRTIAAPAYLDRAGAPQTPDDLARHQCISFISPAGNPMPWNFRTSGEDIRMSPTGPLRLDQGAHLVDAALSGLGIAQVFSFMADDLIAPDNLVRLLKPYECEGPDVHALTLPARPRSAKIRTVLDFLYEEFRRFA